MTWTHTTNIESIHEVTYLVSPDGELRAHDHRPDDPGVARIYVRIVAYKGTANVKVTVVDAKCAPWNDERMPPQFELNADVTPESELTLVDTVHYAIRDLAHFYAALRRACPVRADTLQKE